MENTLKYGKCRCCLAKGKHRDLVREYDVNNKRVIYRDYFLECFNIFLSTNSQLTTLICALCIKQLRQARSFRAQVLRNERRLLKAQGNFKETEFVNVLLSNAENVLDEEVLVKQETESCDYEYTNSVDYVADSDGSEVDLVPGERELLARFQPALRSLPTRDALFTMYPAFYGHLEALKGRTIKGKTIEQLLNPVHRREKRVNDKLHVAISEKLAQALNATTLLENSNATVFKGKMRCGFPCFYCRDIFVNPKSLRQHQIKHPKTQLFKLLSKYPADALIVYADVTDLKCTICDTDIPNLDGLKIHLTETHAKKLYEDYPNRVIPFRLGDKGNNFECQVCGRVFETFGATDKHMNLHYKNFVCEECGAGFITKHRLKVHTYKLHCKKGVIKCEPCNKIFASKYKFKIHHENVHKKMKKMRCTECSEKFIDFFSRQRHMEEKHGLEPLSYKCTECDRAFNRKYSLTCHIKRIHLAKRDVQCELCPFMCFNKSELRHHMVKHGGEKSFECTLCHKSFARKKTLTVHMRIHSEDKRYSCHLCGETFTQSCSLKAHLKAHGVEYADL